jgi:hypothetical protein
VDPALLKKVAGETKAKSVKRVRFGEVSTVTVERWIIPSVHIHPNPDVYALDNLDEDEDEEGEMFEGGCSTSSPSAGPRGRDCPQSNLTEIRNNCAALRSNLNDVQIVLADLRRRLESSKVQPLEPRRRPKVKLGNAVSLTRLRLTKKSMKSRNLF